MPDDKLKILYDNLIGTGKITQKEMGDFSTFSKLMSDSTNVRTFYDNITSGGIVSPNETGDFDTFYKFVSESIQPKIEDFDLNKIHDDLSRQYDSIASIAQTELPNWRKIQLDKAAQAMVPPSIGQLRGKEPEPAPTPEEQKFNEYQSKLSSLRDAQDLVRKTQKFLESGAQDAGVAKQFWEGIKSPLAKDFFSAGLTEMARQWNIAEVARKSAQGEQLNDQEKALLSTYGMYQTLLSGGSGSMAYDIGQQIAMQIPYMVQFAATKGIGTAAKSGVNAALKIAERNLPQLLKDEG